jgi:glycosyltransferase involved in cell wall biosynthesis
MMKDIIFINQSVSQLFAEVVNEFCKAGYKCTLLTGSEEGIQLESGIKTVIFKKYDRTSLITRLKTWLIFTWQSRQYLRNHKKAELFIVSNPAFVTLLPIWVKNPYSLLIYDTYPDALVSTGMMKRSNFIVKWWAKKNINRIYKDAKVVYTLSESMAKALEKYTTREKIQIIPNWADTSFLKPIEHKDNFWLIEKGLQDKFIVLYSGNIGNTHKVESLVDVAHVLKDRKDIQFIIIGDGGKKEIVKNRIEELGVGNVLLLPYQDNEIIPYSIGAADIGVITLDEKSSEVSVPSKTYSMMAVGSCLMCIASKKSELSDLVDEHDCGKVFSSDDVQGMADFIVKMASDKELLHKMKNNSRKASLNFTPENAKKYVELYKR